MRPEIEGVMPASLEAPARVIPITSTPSKPAWNKRRRRIIQWIFGVFLAVALAAGGSYWRISTQNKITFETVPLEQGAIQSTITATGTLNPVVNVQVSSQVSGNIQALYADFNTQVKKGQLVALIDPQIFQAQVNQAAGSAGVAAAAVVTGQAQIEKAKAELAGAVASRDNLQSALAKDEANALNAKIQLQRAEVLFKQQPSPLSGGQQQRVAIARALINNPEILLADEPTGQLDSRTSVEIMKIFQELNRDRGITIVLITHSDEVAAYADRVIRFRDGSVVADEPVVHPAVNGKETTHTAEPAEVAR